jgi:hydroxymethylbilane synthase
VTGLRRSLASGLGSTARLIVGGWNWAGKAVDSLLFPSYCPICDADTGGPAFCQACREELLGASGPTCPRCAMPVGPYADLTGGCSECRGRSLGFDRAIALGPYQGPIRHLCLNLKLERNAWMARWLAELVVEGRSEALRLELGADSEAWVVPIPLHWRRRLVRGSNQAEALAVGMARSLRLKVRPVLRRVNATPSLASEGRAERAKIMKQAFRARPSPGLKGRTILLVDDILTTGATCGAAARALKRAGASRVVVVVVGRTSSEPISRIVEPGGPGGGKAVMAVDEVRVLRKPIRIGTRGSHLARWQSEWVADRLREHHPALSVELVEIKTQGDRDRNSPLAAIGGSGLFTKEIQRALAEGLVEVAVHSLKDLPTLAVEGLTLGAVPVREDVADALIAPVAKTLEALPAGATVGTGSLRRRAQLLHARPDLQVVGVRGNVETRLNKALLGELDAVVLAEAGLRRLGLGGHITQRLGPPGFLPAVGQGALGIECRVDDESTRELLRSLDDPATHRAVIAERRVLAELEGGCMIPLAAFARDVDGLLALDAFVLDPDGKERIAASATGPIDDPDGLGRRVAEVLRAEGADRLLRGSG